MSLKGFSATPYYQELISEIGLIKHELATILEEQSDVTKLYRAQGGIMSLSMLEDRIEQAEHLPEPSLEPDYLD